MTGGSLRFVRRLRRRVRCLRKGHRYQLHQQLHGDVMLVSDRCVRCGNSVVRGIRALTPRSQAPATEPAAEPPAADGLQD